MLIIQNQKVTASSSLNKTLLVLLAILQADTRKIHNSNVKGKMITVKSQIVPKEVPGIRLLDNDDKMKTDLSGVPAAQAVPFTVEPPKEG